MLAAHELAGELDHGRGVRAETAALEPFGRVLPLDVDHGREVDLDVEVAERHADDAAEPARHLARVLPLEEGFGARHAGDEVPQPVDPASFLIDQDERRARRMRLAVGDEVAELRFRFDVPAEEHDRVRRGFAENPLLHVRERGSGDADADDSTTHPVSLTKSTSVLRAC